MIKLDAMIKPIPDTEDPKTTEEHDFSDSAFVQIKSGSFFDVRMKYVEMKMDNAQEKCIVRKEVYERLQKVRDYLPEGYRLRIWDAWRPLALQVELFEKYSKDIVREFSLEDLTEEQRNKVIARFVSLPNEDRTIPPVHTTGGAVDVTLVDKDGNELPMGTGFDSFSKATQTEYFEKEKNILFRDNRRLLYNAMIGAGFTNLPSEWWHYDYGDRFWAYYNNVPVIYDGRFTLGETEFL